MRQEETTLTPLQKVARDLQAKREKDSQLLAENAALRAEVEALKSRQPTGVQAGPAAPKATSKEERLRELNRKIEASTNNAEIWALSEEIDRVRSERPPLPQLEGMSKEEKLRELSRIIDASTDNAEIWALAEEMERVRGQ